MMVSLGYPDGEEIPWDEFVSAVKRISRVISLPLSVDMVGGFGGTPESVAKSVKAIIAAGAVGINIEDYVHKTKTLVPLQKHLAKLRTLVKLGSQKVPFVINARTDALRYADGDAEAKLEEAVERAKAFRDAGVDCVYPMGLMDPASILRFVKAVDFPTNVMVRKGLPTITELKQMGVARVSFGPSASYAAMGLMKRASREILDNGTYGALTEGAITIDELNSLAIPKPT
jgi:2-methylisocitrate lyase-like PEP mutase family enzyme